MIYKIYIKPLSQQLAVFEKKEKSCKIRKKYILMNLSKDTKKKKKKKNKNTNKIYTQHSYLNYTSKY